MRNYPDKDCNACFDKYCECECNTCLNTRERNKYLSVNELIGLNLGNALSKIGIKDDSSKKKNQTNNQTLDTSSKLLK